MLDIITDVISHHKLNISQLLNLVQCHETLGHSCPQQGHCSEAELKDGSQAPAPNPENFSQAAPWLTGPWLSPAQTDLLCGTRRNYLTPPHCCCFCKMLFPFGPKLFSIQCLQGHRACEREERAQQGKGKGQDPASLGSPAAPPAQTLDFVWPSVGDMICV